MFLLLFKLVPFVMLIILLVMIGTNNVQYSQLSNNPVQVNNTNSCDRLIEPEKPSRPTKIKILET